MLPCNACHRHVRPDESSCPFCGAAITLTGAPASPMSSWAAFAAGLTLFACTSGDDGSDDNSMTNASETMSTMGDGDGDTQDPDYSGSEYGGPPPCDILDTAIPLSVGSNPVDTTAATNDYTTACGDTQGSGPDQLFRFNAPAAGSFSITANVNVDAWLLEFGGYYCSAYDLPACTPGIVLEFGLLEGQTVDLLLDGTAGATGSIDVTQN